MRENVVCEIWETPATILPSTSGIGNLDSPRAGGKYSITGSAIAMASHLIEYEKVLLTNWLVEQRRLGVESPKITSMLLNEIRKNRAPSVQDRADSMLRYLELKSNLLGDIIWFINDPLFEASNDLLAWTGSLNIREIKVLSDYCVGHNWIMGDGRAFTLQPDGYTRLTELDGANTDSIRCFVAMWFDGSMNEAYDKGIQPAVRGGGFEPVRVDQQEHIDKIDDRIIAEIRRSRFIVADFTSEPDKPRGGVYYEAGFAQGLNIPVIWTCRKDMINNVHFDTRQFNHIVWETPEDLHKKLLVCIGAVIGYGPLKTMGT